MSTELQTTPPAPREKLVVHDDGPSSYLFDTARFEHMQRVALAMARASLLPEHLKGKTPEQTAANCLLIVNQAVRWDMDPFAVAPETYVVKGKLGFQGKLVCAVVHARGNLVGRLAYSHCRDGDDRTVTVTGQFADEKEPRSITLSVKQAKTDNSMWRTDPDQKLVYSGVTKWARRHCPELMLGVMTVDDLERMAVQRMDGTPAVEDHVEQARQLRAEEATTEPLDASYTVDGKHVADEPPYDPPTPEEQSQVAPEVEATEGVDDPAEGPEDPKEHSSGEKCHILKKINAVRTLNGLEGLKPLIPENEMFLTEDDTRDLWKRYNEREGELSV